MKILKSSALREAEKRCVEEYGISYAVLMERAALALFEECVRFLSPLSKVLVLAGYGNNGGDGLALARLLHLAGYKVTVFVSAGKKASELFTLQRRTLEKLKVAVRELPDRKAVRELTDFSEFDLIVDALIGIGANRPAEGAAVELIKLANLSKAKKVSADIPSGLLADALYPVGETFLADMTVSFTCGKICSYFYPARAFCGEVIVKDIGIPRELLESPLTLLTEKNTSKPPVRNIYGHKNDYGHVAVVGGSIGKSGAAVLAARAALKAGAGLVTAILPQGTEYAVGAFPEIMSAFFGKLGAFSSEDAAKVSEFITPQMNLAVGPGLSRSESALKFAKELILSSQGFLVLDADALNAVDDEVLKAINGRAILTPHIGEFARLTGQDKNTVLASRLELSFEYAVKNNIYLVLKGAETVITTPTGEQFVSLWGTPALSKGGTGDILTGIITALLAQGFSFLEAAKTACFMQGEAARAASKDRSEASVTVAEIIELL